MQGNYRIFTLQRVPETNLDCKIHERRGRGGEVLKNTAQAIQYLMNLLIEQLSQCIEQNIMSVAMVKNPLFSNEKSAKIF